MLVTQLSSFHGETQEVIVATLNGLSAGTIIYVVMFEVLQRERERGKEVAGVLQLIAIIAGFSAMLLVETFAGHSHEHEDNHLEHNHDQILDMDELGHEGH